MGEFHLMIPISIFDRLMTSDFTLYERRIIDIILRLSVGCGKSYACIPYQQDFKLVGVPACKVKACLDLLIQNNIIERKGKFYKINLKVKEWSVAVKSSFSNERLKDLIYGNLNQNDLIKSKGCLSNSKEINNKKVNNPKSDLALQNKNRYKDIYTYNSINIDEKLINCNNEKNLFLYKARKEGKEYSEAERLEIEKSFRTKHGLTDE